MAAHRIVSLLPAATEMVAALGQRDLLVGRSHECDFPPDVESLPVCSAPTIDIDADSAAINRQVERSLAAALSIYRVDIERIRQLQPTLILTQMQCDVCAVSEDDVRAAVAELDTAPTVLSLSPAKLSDLWENIASVAGAAGTHSTGSSLIADLQNRLNRLREVMEAAERPRVACIEWLAPLMTAGNWVPELIDIAGGTDVLGQAGEHSPWIEWSTLSESDPDVILVFPCGFTLERTRRELHVVTERPEWGDLRAVRNGRVFLIDGHHYLNRPGPRLIDSAEIIAEILHPALYRRPANPASAGNSWSAAASYSGMSQ